MATTTYFRADDGSINLPVDLTGSASTTFEVDIPNEPDYQQYRITFSDSSDFSSNDTPTGGTVTFEFSQFKEPGRWDNPVDGSFGADQVNADGRFIPESVGSIRRARLTLENITGTTSFARAFVLGS